MNKHKLFAALVLALLILPHVAHAAAPVVNAGVNKTMAFPQVDLTLFGEASDADNDPLQITWSQVSGPGGATMSAPWAIHNTITFTNTGTYVFRLSASDGTTTVTDDTTVVVSSAASQTAFYVDPTYVGGSSNGSAARPWTTISGLGSGSAPWTAINSALASNHVIVYFSARQAGSNTPEVDHAELNLWRSNTSTNRLTLDGMTLYNTNDTSGVWAANTGGNKFHVAITSGSTGIGVQANGNFPMQYTTVRGFDVSGNTGRLTVAGDYMDIEYIDMHDITGSGGTIQLQPPRTDFPVGCTVLFGVRTNMAFRHNTITNGYGEGLYMAGTYRTTAQNGCPANGNTHRHILLENNNVLNAGRNGGQGDGIDLKAGLQWVTVRKNTIADCYSTNGFKSQCNGITSDGVFSPSEGTYTIEQNVIHGCQRCMYLGPNFDMTIRNNVVYDSTQMGLAFDTQSPGINRVHIYNNTFYGNADVGMNLSGITNSDTRNNLLFGNNSNSIQSFMSGATAVSNNFNGYGIGGPHTNMAEGAGSINFGTNTGLVIDAANGNFALGSSSPARNVGTSLATTGFANDIVDVTRPQGAAWDMGAYESVAAAAPTVSAIAPASGPTSGGTSITITGTNYTSVLGVSFGAFNATSFVVNSPTQITALAPAQSAGTVDVRVQTSNGLSAVSAADRYTFIAPPPPPPAITAILPNNGPVTGGTVVTIQGNNFKTPTVATFGGTNATGVVVNSATQITATAPAHSAGTVDVVVATSDGTSAIVPADQYTFNALPPPPPPTVTGLAPTNGLITGGTSVTITGTNYTGVLGVKFGATTASFTVNSPTQITAISPAVATAGPVDVRVTTNDGTSAITTADLFQYNPLPPPPPVVTSISPTFGPTAGGTSVTITGTDLQNTTAVRFGLTDATSFTQSSATELVAISPAHSAGVVHVRVTNLNGTSTAVTADQFTFNVTPPTVTGLSPNNGTAAGTTVVILAGMNFTGTTAVAFGATPATTFTVLSDTNIQATAPAHTAGVVNVTVTTPNGTSVTGAANQFTFNAIPPPPGPTVTSVSPATGNDAGGTNVNIAGTNFTGVLGVTFGGVAAASFAFVNDSALTAVSPPHAAGDVDVVVTTTNGVSPVSSADQFTFVRVVVIQAPVTIHIVAP